MTRRSAMGLLGAGGLTGALIGGAQKEPVAPNAPATDGVLRAGARFGRWTIARVHPIDRGALLVDVRERGHSGRDDGRDDGREFALEILARDPSPLASRPPAHTSDLAIYVRNGGDGFQATVEEQGLAAMTLAHRLETRGEGGPIAGLLTHADRLATHRSSLVHPV